MTDVKIKRDFALDYIRMLATFMIAFCHFFQILDIYGLAFWLNTGVQIFLILSVRLLYRKRFESVREVLEFYKSKILRIMIPVWIYTLAICFVLFIIKYPLSITTVVIYMLGGAAFIDSGILGLGHFWYISIILIAYFLVPLLSLFAEKSKKLSAFALAAICFGIFAVLTGVFYFIGNAFYGVNLSLFVIAYYIFQRSDSEEFESRAIKYTLAPALIAIILRIVLEYMGISAWSIYGLYDSVFVTVCKSLLAFVLFFVFYKLFNREYFRRFNKYALAVSTFSFEIYITHQFIELAVYEYVPYCDSGTFIGAVVMLVASVMLIVINTLLLRFAVNVLNKIWAVIKK